MSEFTKKAETKPTKIYRVRDFLELFSHGKADIKIHVGKPNKLEERVIFIFWNYIAGKYYTDEIPSEILDTVVLDNLVLAGSAGQPEINLFI